MTMPRPVAWLLAGGVLAIGVAIASWWLVDPVRAVPGVLLAVGPAAKSDPYAVAQGAVTHGESVLIDFGDGDFAFFVNRSDDVLALVNGCGDRVVPVRQQRFPVLVEARFHARNVPPYRVDTPSVQYLFESSGPRSTSCE